MDFEEKVCKFNEEHPFWSGLIARFVICTCVCIIAASVFFALIAIFAPFVHIADGAGWEAFAAWLWLPIISTIVWLMIAIITYVWDEVFL